MYFSKVTSTSNVERPDTWQAGPTRKPPCRESRIGTARCTHVPACRFIDSASSPQRSRLNANKRTSRRLRSFFILSIRKANIDMHGGLQSHRAVGLQLHPVSKLECIDGLLTVEAVDRIDSTPKYRNVSKLFGNMFRTCGPRRHAGGRFGCFSFAVRFISICLAWCLAKQIGRFRLAWWGN